MSLNRGRFIIGERPAPDVIQCLRCRRMWDANVHTGLQCVVCKTNWTAAPEWDRSCVIRRLWIIESRWRIGLGHGRWQHVAQLPGSHTPLEVEEVLQEYRAAEQKRSARKKRMMTFEFQSRWTYVEIYQGSLAATKSGELCA